MKLFIIFILFVLISCNKICDSNNKEVKNNFNFVNVNVSDTCLIYIEKRKILWSNKNNYFVNSNELDSLICDYKKDKIKFINLILNDDKICFNIKDNLILI